MLIFNAVCFGAQTEHKIFFLKKEPKQTKRKTCFPVVVLHCAFSRLGRHLVGHHMNCHFVLICILVLTFSSQKGRNTIGLFLFKSPVDITKSLSITLVVIMHRNGY